MKRRRLNDVEKVIVKSNRVRLTDVVEEEHICPVCERIIGGREVCIGKNVFRCYSCYPGSPEWINSTVGKQSSFRKLFLKAARITRRKGKLYKPKSVEYTEMNVVRRSDMKPKIERKRLQIRRIVIKKEHKLL